MAGSVKATPPKRERRIGGTTYIVTSHFKEQGVTAADHVRRLLDTATTVSYTHLTLPTILLV